MSKNLNIWCVPDDIRLKMRLLCAGRGLSMAKLLSDLVEKAWENDHSIPTPKVKTKMKRLIKRWKP